MFYFLVVLFIFIVYRLSQSAGFSKKHAYYIIAGLTVITMFYAPEKDSDLSDYVYNYYEIISLPWSYIIDYWRDYFGYYASSKIFALTGLPASIWCGTVQLIYLLSIWSIVKRFSSNPVISFLLYVTIGLYAFSMQALKQTLGAAFMMLAFSSMIDKKYVRMVLFAVWGYLCHGSVGLFALTMPLYFIRNKKYFWPVIVTVLAILTLSMTSTLTYFVEQSGRERYIGYLERDYRYTYVFFVFILSLLLFSFKYYNRCLEFDDGTSKFLYGCSVIATGLLVLAPQYSFLFRITNLYLPFMICLIPSAINMETNSHKTKNIYLLIFLYVSFFYIYTSRNFIVHFGWF